MLRVGVGAGPGQVGRGAGVLGGQGGFAERVGDVGGLAGLLGGVGGGALLQLAGGQAAQLLAGWDDAERLGRVPVGGPPLG